MNEFAPPMPRSLQNIRISQIKVFVAAADSGSFTRAASLVSLSQPSLSRCIKDLEDVLGTVLFLRKKCGAQLSAQGHSFLPLARHLLRSHSDALSGVQQWRGGAACSLSIVGSVSVMPIVLPLLLGNLRVAYGRASMQARSALSSEVVQQVLDGGAALGVCADVQAHPALRHTPVLEAQFGILASANCPLPESIRSLCQLDHVPFVRCVEQAVVTQALRRGGVDFPAYFNSPIVVDNVQVATELLPNVGMATVATGIGASHAKAANLKFVPLPGLLPVARVDIVSLRDTIFDESRERLREILRASIHEAPWHVGVRRIGATSESASVNDGLSRGALRSPV